MAADQAPEAEEEDTDNDLDEDQGSVLSLIKAMPGNVSLDSMLTEIRKLTAIRAIGLPADLFADVAPKVLAGWRTNHYRRGLIELLEMLEFRSNNTAHQPVIEALKLVKRYAKAGNTTYYPLGETAPEHKGTLKDWADPGAAHRLLLGPGARWRRHDRAAPDTRQDVQDRHRRAGKPRLRRSRPGRPMGGDHAGR